MLAQPYIRDGKVVIIAQYFQDHFRDCVDQGPIQLFVFRNNR